MATPPRVPPPCPDSPMPSPFSGVPPWPPRARAEPSSMAALASLLSRPIGLKVPGGVGGGDLAAETTAMFDRSAITRITLRKYTPDLPLWDACAICDDGGELIWCEGGCLRSFHPIKICGLDSMCTSLGLTEEHWQTLHANKQEKYICKNCENKQHQCFACGLLGSSDLISGSEVFKCKEKNCGHFYHPKCVAELLYPDSKGLAIYFEEHVASGLEFHCLMHRCSLCKEAENRDDTDMQLAVCRRCPTAYHRKCLPSDISFIEDNDEGTQQRAWDNILPDQILIYCMKHEIDKDLGTPKRDHIVFPDDRPLSEPPQSSQPAEMGSDRVKGIDSFASKHLFPHPQPGSCGWIDD
ncbi:protein ENHANCED DOWNY MILDEW 2 isoform X1 [Brachypodium distachyon]|uniref:Zinc finger PHD-type domain-containing protein n=1 Tax=Brachypodium distachyon TaxID=15368 RepID=A0A2K2CTE4_BRADI|nr:protein ENHANCED DOWNY MILDEW 2 isoform X1 [Brachypodium distachyon]PNT65300.1 hypothetical protein BRADI_4g40054v3 [Brachypodium distachyon]|eukprot:XP_010238606.1 protein ENHANCED DOWNY MILDEW 2 isoform X1 [Brachypodium distachyon]